MRGLIISLCFFCLVAEAGPGREALTAFLQDLDTLQADFTQTVYDLENGRQGVSNGIFKLRRPDRFRWDYQAPEARLILADGRDLWIVENDLEQITQYHQSMALRNTPVTILLADKPLDEAFAVKERGLYADLFWLELKPHDAESDVEQVLLGLSEDQLEQLELTDKFGQITQFRFSAMRKNPVLSDDEFAFQPPEDWDVFAH